MRSTLRHIAVHVEETDDASYAWVLIERGKADAWHEIGRSVAPASTFRKAMADGLVALEALVDDLDVGPRHAGGAGKAHPSRKPADADDEADAQSDDSEPPKASRPSLFGFGPAR